MSTTVFSLKDYILFTFVSTSQALKAERVMKNYGADFVMIPTLREISSSCGLSVKIAPDMRDEYRRVLQENNVTVEEIYQVEKQGSQNLIQKVETEQ